MPDRVQMQVVPCSVQRGPGTGARGDIACGVTSWGEVVISIRHPDAQVTAVLTVDQLHRLGAVGKASLTEMDAGELTRVLARLNQDASPDRKHVGKVRALWWTLYWLDAVEQATPNALDTFVQRQTGVAALRFLDHRQAHSVIDALKGWAAREGVRWPQPASLLGDRRAVADAIWAKLPEPPIGGVVAFLAPLLGVAPEHVDRWAAYEWDAGIKLLGKRLRRAMGKPA